jgi:phosphoribosylformylglycinamidine cyclo-ligase
LNDIMAGLTYRDAGVDIDAGDDLVERIKPFAKRTMRKEVLAGIGGFGALMELPKRFREPVLVSGTDGVGTKLKLAFATGIHDTIGIDLVAMSVNDILVQGAEPLFFLDYFVCERLDVPVAADVIKGIAKGCERSGCALIGGETAEHPDAFPKGEYDLAGFAVGVVEKSKALNGLSVKPGDTIIGLASSGLHSNGFSLVRKVIDTCGADLTKIEPIVDEKLPLGQALLTPTRIYVLNVLSLLEVIDVKAMAHITGGGITENAHRMFPENVVGVVQKNSWQLPGVFQWLQAKGGIAEAELHRTFNCGVGFIVVVANEDATRTIAHLNAHGEMAWKLGEIRARVGDEPQTQIV